jgi:Tol biopolymer transport system component
VKKLLIPLSVVLAVIAGCGPSVNPNIQLAGKIVYATEYEGGIHVMRIDPQGENREVLTDSETLRGASSIFDACMLPGGDLEIYKLDLENLDAEPERLTHSRSDDTDPVVRPDGRFVAFVSDQPGAYDLFAVDLTGEEPLRRLTDEDGDVSKPSFSADGEYVIYEVMIHGNPEIAYCNFDSPTEHGTVIQSEEWSEYSPCFSPNGEYICVESDREGTGDLCIFTFGGDFIRRVTDTPEFETDVSWTR